MEILDVMVDDKTKFTSFMLSGAPTLRSSQGTHLKFVECVYWVYENGK